ncbi:MAG: leucine-rich repeat protein, partial [Lachnospiraceae bacterium]|nr:leucine-rich repeat protein [Lachnospiraceae bacterium]
GNWTWVDSSTSVGNVGQQFFKANFTPEDTTNYKSVNNVNVKVIVGKGNNPTTVENSAVVKIGGSTIDLANNVRLYDAAGAVSYQISGETCGCTLAGSVLTTGDVTGSVTVKVTVAEDEHYIALNEAFISVSVTEKLIQTISASDVTATYGDTDKSIHATVSGNGALSYAVKDGSEDLIGVDASSGALTTKKVGTATVLVMAEETEDYALAVKEVSVTILPADSVVTKAPTANSLIYTGIAQQLVTEGEATGGSMQYALGTRTEVTGIFSDTPPSVTEVGTFYVWYRVNGDVNHNDTDINEAVMVNISRKTVTVTGITAENKVYDGNNAATLVTTTASFDGMVEGDDLTVTATGTFDTADAGENKTVTISNLALGGTSVNNYTIAQGNDPITVNAAIIAKEVGLTWTNTDLTYTGSAQKPVATATGLVGEDTCTVTVTGEQTNAGNYTATASSLSNGNYSLPIDATISFGIGKADSSVETDPTAKSLKYNGQAQALVTGGTATGGTMIYAVTTENTVPTSESFNDGSIPTAMNAGTYYVWYKVVGDENHNGISPTFVKVEVAKASGTATVGKTATAYINGKPLDLSVYVKDAVGEVTYVIKEALDGCSVDANTGMFTQGISQGKCVVEVSIAESNNYTAQTEEIEVSVVSKSQDMLEVILEDIEYGAVLSQPVYYIAGTEETPTGGTEQITYSGKLKKDESDYSSETAPTEAGDYDVQVLYETDTTLYVGDAHFQIKPFDIQDAEVTLSASELTYTGSEQTVSVTQVTLGGQILSSAEYSVFGNQATDADDYTLTVSAIDAGNYTGSITKAFVIKKATPYVKTNPTAESIIYGQCLADSALSNGEAQISESIETLVPGSFAWEDMQEKPPITDGNMSKYAVIFTPEDTKNLEPVTVYVSLEVAKIKCAPNCPESTMEVGYGVKKANEIVLPEGWVISDADQETELVAGKAVTVTAVYDKVDKENYETNSIKISVTRKGFSYADLIPTGGDGDQEAVNDKMVTFNGMQWYIIEDNSTSTNSGTVTLLAKDHVGTSVFGETAEYSGSTIQSFLADYYRDHFSGMDDAVVDEGLGRLYLLSVEEAKAITNTLVRKCADYDGSDSELEFWWLRSKSNVSDERAAIVYNRDDNRYRIDESGNWIGFAYCVRPALKLDLAAVTISPETKTFTLKNQDTQNNTNTNTVSGNTSQKEDEQEVPGNKDSTVTPDISDKPDATKEKKPDTTQKQDVTERQDPNTSEKQDTTKEQNTTGKARAKGTKLSASDSKAVYVVTSREGQEPAVEYRPATGFKDKTIKIPESVTEDGVTYKVTAIAKKAFKGNKKIQSVVIPASVTQVGNNAFEGCKNLKTVVIGKRIKKLGANLFKGCGKLKTVTIKSTGLSADNVNKKAFTGVGNEVIFKVPKKQKKVYTAMFRKKGLPKKVKIK